MSFSRIRGATDEVACEVGHHDVVGVEHPDPLRGHPGPPAVAAAVELEGRVAGAVEGELVHHDPAESGGGASDSARTLFVCVREGKHVYVCVCVCAHVCLCVPDPSRTAGL